MHPLHGWTCSLARAENILHGLPWQKFLYTSRQGLLSWHLKTLAACRGWTYRIPSARAGKYAKTIADHGPNSFKMCICVTNIHIELTPLNGLVPVTGFGPDVQRLGCTGQSVSQTCRGWAGRVKICILDHLPRRALSLLLNRPLAPPGPD